MAHRVDRFAIVFFALCFTATFVAGFRKRSAEDYDDEPANKCYEDEPWPCKTPGFCISLEYICDGNRECPDGYDEDPKLCRAKLRPPKDAVISIINKSFDNLIPDVLGPVTATRSAHLLTVASGVDDYAHSAGMNEQQTERLRALVHAVEQQDRRALEKINIPLSAWSDLSWLIDKLLAVGFEA